MRVGIIADSYPAQTFIERHAKGLDADLIVPYRKLPASLDSLASSAKIYALHCEPPRVERFIGKVARRLRETMSDMRVRPWSPEMEALFDRYVDERNPDLVLAEFAPNALQALDGCRRHGIPLVVHFHGYDASSMLRHKGYVSQLPGLFDKSAAVVAVSRDMASTLIALGCPRQKISLIPYGAPVDQISPREVERREECRFVAVCRMIPMKGPLLAIRAFAHCRRSVKRTSLTMIGEGPLLRPARRLARSLGIEREVTFLGYQTFEVVQDLLRKSDIFVQHSLTTQLGHKEGWPVAIAEAQLAALPVVATHHAGIPDEVIDGETGYLVPEGDWQAMGERMIKLARDAELRDRMGLAARTHIANIGDATDQIRKLRALLADCVTSSTVSLETRR